MKPTLAALTALLLAPLGALHGADLFLTVTSQPRAEIVLAEKPPRMASLAAAAHLRRRCSRGRRVQPCLHAEHANKHAAGSPNVGKAATDGHGSKRNSCDAAAARDH